MTDKVSDAEMYAHTPILLGMGVVLLTVVMVATAVLLGVAAMVATAVGAMVGLCIGAVLVIRLWTSPTNRTGR